MRYDEEWLQSDRRRPLSLSLPLQTGLIRTAAVGAYFDNLLPDSEPIRKRLQARFGTATRGAFDLLEAIGQDCVGAAQLMPLGCEPTDYRKTEATPLSEAEVAQVLCNTTLPGGGIHREAYADFRISIAGAQEKTALTWLDGQWCLPHGATPTTHIFKLPLGLVGARKADMRTSVENEWLCAQVLDLFGVPVAETAMASFEDQKALLVTRFDRQQTAQGHWLRLPQEDFCQALGYPSALKYESDGGPGHAEIVEKLVYSRNSRDLETFFRAQVLFWMLAATDGHAKNFSIRLLPGSAYEMTPMYDVLSAWPVTGQGANLLDYKELKLAMALRSTNAHYLLEKVQARHFVHFAERCRLPRDHAIRLIEEVIAMTPGVLDKAGALLPDGYPMDVFEAITKGLQWSAERLGKSLASGR
ncbi:MAG: type II toxin-antitoxin system HipA family toxin [Rhodocyclales bacterium]|nr:type II toxin-antitoxin system HipA family toxin [Rhodocyclales bacterium]